MKSSLPIWMVPAAAFAALAALAGAAPPSPAPELGGRTAGKPQRCVGAPPGTLFQTSGSDPRLLIYDDGKTIWASRLDSRCGFGTNASVIPDEAAAYYCRGDFVRQGSRIELSPFGNRCTLGDFTPYRTAT